MIKLLSDAMGGELWYCYSPSNLYWEYQYFLPASVPQGLVAEPASLASLHSDQTQL